MCRLMDKIEGVGRIIGFLSIAFVLSYAAAPAEEPHPFSAPSREKVLKLLEDTNVHLRAYAVYIVARRFPEDAAALVPFVSDREPLVRRAAIFSLGLLRFEAETERFLQALKDTHYGVRRAAVFALGNIGSRKAALAIMIALKDDDSMVRQLAALAMARAGVKESVPKLISLLRDESPRVRRAAACALGMLGDRSALDPLRRLHRDRRSSEAPERMPQANRKVQETLSKKVNLDYKFLHFAETLDKLSEAAGMEIRVDDEVLFVLNISADEPQNLNSIKLAMWNVPLDKALEKIVQTVGACYYVESGAVNISSRRYRAYDVPVALEAAGAMAALGDSSALSEVRRFLEDPRFGQRAREILRTVTGR